MMVMLFIGFANSVAQTGYNKPRIIVLTDIENEPDDAMSLVRFLTYANQWDVEGLVATTSVHQQNEIATWRIFEILEAYGLVRDNLLKHEPGYPAADDLVSVVREGWADYGMNAVGKGMDSPGSDLIIQAVDRDDPRPVWVLVEDPIALLKRSGKFAKPVQRKIWKNLYPKSECIPSPIRMIAVRG